jgi:hypothetical protein
MKPRHAAALALVGWYVIVPSDTHAQSQLHIPRPPVIAESAAAAPYGNNTLEIPVVVQPNQPPLDPRFVGVWCGDEQFKFYADAPPGSAHEPPGVRQVSSRCYTFARSGNGVSFGGSILASPGPVAQRVVSQSADAVSAREITVTTILETKIPPIRSTATVTWNFKLDAVGSASPSRIVFTRRERIVDTTLDFTPIHHHNAPVWLQPTSGRAWRGRSFPGAPVLTTLCGWRRHGRTRSQIKKVGEPESQGTPLPGVVRASLSRTLRAGLAFIRRKRGCPRRASRPPGRG